VSSKTSIPGRITALITSRVRQVAQSILRSVESSIPYSSPKFIAVGVLGVVGFPLYYFVWHDLFPQPYENLPLRLAGAALFFPLLLVPLWPQRLRRFLPIYWYGAIWFALPFFFAFMFFKNGGSHAWSMSVLVAVFLMTLLVDWRSLIIMFGLGGFVAWIAYYFTTDPILPPTLYGADFAVFLFALVAGSIFNLGAERVTRARLAAMLTAANNIAHELRTPLLGIKCTAMGLRKYLPVLLDAYQIARDRGLARDEIRTAHYEGLIDSVSRIEQETDHANTMIDILLINSRQTAAPTDDFASTSMARCVKLMLNRYPFASPRDQERVVWEEAADFRFVGSELLMVHVFFNLMKNALLSVAKARKGNIHIWLSCNGGQNAVHFKDTGLGIPAQVLPQIFRRFYSWSQDSGSERGTGVGLAFCKLVVESFGARIVCRSEHGAFTEFVIIFPEERTYESLSHPSILLSDHGRARG
jgi:signal transduction histidine kinase